MRNGDYVRLDKEGFELLCKDFQDFYGPWPFAVSLGQDVTTREGKIYRKNCQKFSFLYLHSIQLAIPKTEIISLCFISLVV